MEIEKQASSNEKVITESTIGEDVNLVHTIAVECAYFEMSDAQENNVVTFTARTKGVAGDEEIDDLDYAVTCSIQEARDFANYILSLCKEIEDAK